MFPPSFFDHLEDRLNLAIYDLNEEWRQVKFKITEPLFFLQKNRKPGEVLESPVGPYKYHVDGGLKRTPQFEEINMTELQNPFNESKTMSVTGIQSGAFQAKLAEMRQKIADRQAQALTKIDSAVASGGAKMDAAVDEVVAKADKEVDAALHEFATFTNGGPA